MLTRRAMLGQFTAAGGAAWALGGKTSRVGAAGRSAGQFRAAGRGPATAMCHVFGDPAKIPIRGPGAPIHRRPPSIEELLELQRDLHMDRVVVVQPSVYGHRQFLHSRCSPPHGCARGAEIAVIDQATSAPLSLEENGRSRHPRKIRLNLSTAGVFRPCLRAAAARRRGRADFRGLNWHVQMYVALSVIAALKDYFMQYPFPVVFDHFGQPKAPLGTGQPRICQPARTGQIGACLREDFRRLPASPRRRPTMPTRPPARNRRWSPPTPTASSWGTDWPHPNGGQRAPLDRGKSQRRSPIDDGLLLKRAAEVGCPTRRRARKFWSTIRRASYGFDARV